MRTQVHMYTCTAVLMYCYIHRSLFESQLQLDERLSGLLESIAGSFRRDFVYRNMNFAQIASAACNSLIVETFEAFAAFEAFEAFRLGSGEFFFCLGNGDLVDE